MALDQFDFRWLKIEFMPLFPNLDNVIFQPSKMDLVQHHLKTSLGTRINLNLNSSWYFIGIEGWTMELS